MRMPKVILMMTYRLRTWKDSGLAWFPWIAWTDTTYMIMSDISYLFEIPLQ